MQNEQITAGKGRLKAQIKELEDQVRLLSNHPLLVEAKRLQKENDRLTKRIEEMEVASCNLVTSAIELVKVVNRSFDEPTNKEAKKG